ncbi:MAG TPA: hypothetical protein VHL12_02010, partial [Gemmatimonadaceae bacterium]|nr:hypothetical protein [Gemmatimonadaceae bacterium]
VSDSIVNGSYRRGHVRILLGLCAACLGGVSSAAADAQTLVAHIGVQTVASQREVHAVDAVAIVTMPTRLGFYRTPDVGVHVKSEAHTRLPHGVIGAVIGAIGGGAIGYARVQMYCDGAEPCDATRSTVTGAAIGAALGALVEYAVRNRHK